jgi:hydrogenase/urease accessory protein HupE
VYADFVNPASLEITELRASEFEIVLTLPLIQGRVLKAKPIFPDTFIIHGEAAERAVSGSVIRTWSMTCDPQDLIGTPIGVQGLLGTSQEILLRIKTLAGRTYRDTLRPTQSFYIIPTPPTVLQLALQTGLLGIQQVLRRFELVLFVCVLLVLGLHWRTLLVITLTFALAQILGQGLGIQNWMMVSPFWARAFCSLTTLLMVSGSLHKNQISAYGLERRIWKPVFLLGMLYGASQSGMVTDWVLSTKEQYLALLFGAIGVLTGFCLLIACVQEAKVVLRTWQGVIKKRWRFWILYGAGILAAALFWYEVSTLAFADGIIPVLPAIFWVAIGCLGLWCRAQAGRWSGSLALIGVSFFGLGLVFSFANVTIPLISLVMLVFLTYLGVTLLFSFPGPVWFRILMVAGGTFYYGFAAGNYVRDATAMPIAHVVGGAVLLSFLFFICYQIMEGGTATVANFPVRVYGLLACALSVLWRLQEYQGWFNEQILPELAMGSMQVPVLTLALLVCAGLAWPRKRSFQVAPAGGPTVMHWFLLGLAFFVFPHGTLSCRRPFYTPRAPTPMEARHIMGRLLADTYLAFNVTDENQAFDALEANLSEDLVADVYLDSRRRLSAGTRQGAQVTVRAVDVKSVDEVLSKSRSNTSFTYPCRWIVTARVKHLQHVHDRQNIYLGELTIGIEDDQWKITKLVLKNEERIIKPWQKA